MKSIELFVGAGGLAIGTSRAGFKHEVVVEWDRDACATLRRNREDGVKEIKDWRIVEGDVRHYDFSQHSGTLDAVVGGPPCQPFSMGGKHLGQEDDRNMFPEAVRAVREVKPKVFIFENVKGLLRSGFANYYNYIILQLSFPSITRKRNESWMDHLARLERIKTSGKRVHASHYHVVYQLLNAADYGVPQQRHRVLIVGIRADMGVKFSFPKPTHSQDALLHDQWVTGEYWDRHQVAKKNRPEMPSRVRRRVDALVDAVLTEMLSPWRTVRDAISDLPAIRAGQTSRRIRNHFLNPGARSYPGHDGSPMDEPAKALKAGDHGVPGGENTLRLGDGNVRYFSVRECARLQTFPDEWTFEGSWTESMRQLGNAVPVKLSEVVASRVKEVMTPVNSLSLSFEEAVSALSLRQRSAGCL